MNTLDGRCNDDVVAMLDHEIATGVELKAEAFANRPLLTRLIQRLAYSLRQWL